MISLSSRDFRLDVVPELGGALAAFKYRDHDVLRPMRSGSDDPFDAASFALVPFANRIAGGAFRFQGREVRIPRNKRGQAHPLHGHAWLAPWKVASASEHSLLLNFEHAADSWPWMYSVEQTLRLREDGLRMELALLNTDSRPMPAGLGWHPYFRRQPGVRLRARVRGAWTVDEEYLPVEHATGPQFGDWTRGEAVERPTLVDNCHTGWDGTAQIVFPRDGLEVTLEASSELRWLHVYIPPGEDFFCVEPVSHMPAAVNRPEPREVTGLAVLEPGQRLTASLDVKCQYSDK